MFKQHEETGFALIFINIYISQNKFSFFLNVHLFVFRLLLKDCFVIINAVKSLQKWEKATKKKNVFPFTKE